MILSVRFVDAAFWQLSQTWKLRRHRGKVALIVTGELYLVGRVAAPTHIKL